MNTDAESAIIDSRCCSRRVREASRCTVRNVGRDIHKKSSLRLPATHRAPGRRAWERALHRVVAQADLPEQLDFVVSERRLLHTHLN
jgi:hypothetical protein